ncbi:MAG TPA: Ezrin/radixin/moesin family protein [Cyclobacteriaceae bacterium]|nr:Ezrin/radixin/moesin family protein [Cyclobacteriaceae bacterium]
MKNQLILLFCLAIFFASHEAYSQLSKSEKKEWKKKAKEYAKSPANLKQLEEDKQAADSKVSSLNQQVNQLQSTMSNKDARIAELEGQLTQAQSQLSAARAELTQLNENPSPMDYSKGIVFKVQIGAFRNKDLSKYFENNPNFGGEKGEDGAQRYTIGVFRDYWEADTFKKYMREMGVKDAWIVPYKDGVRVEIKDVLEGVTAEKPAQTSN